MAVNLVNSEFVATLSEAAGFKTGIALDKSQLVEAFPDDSEFKELLSVENESVIRIESTEIDEIFMQILYYLGNVNTPDPVPSTIHLFHKYKRDKTLYPIYMGVFELYAKHLKSIIEDAKITEPKSLDPTNFLKECAMKHGKIGLDIGVEFIKGISDDTHCKLSSYRRFDWSNTIDLEGLFKSESLESQYGEFIDQRFIDFLNRNRDKLGEMHWRKFEGLTAEYFLRHEYKVELGPGRNDGGIDVRVWKKDADEGEAPLILVQCKRYKSKIDRTVIKALWADVDWEKAESGLIVTTSSIAPSAQHDCIARGYNIRQADKDVIVQWLDSMKTPGTGVFMGK